MEKSILNTIKQMLGPEADVEAFDTDIIVHINSSLMTLQQLGVGKKNFSITGPEETWNSFIDNEDVNLEAVKTYVYLKTKLVFDPPANSFVVESMERTCKEYEWRLYANAEISDDSTTTLDAGGENQNGK